MIFCGYGMGIGIEIPSPRQPCIFVELSYALATVSYSGAITEVWYAARFYGQLNTKWVISETFFTANLLARYRTENTRNKTNNTKPE